MVDHRESEESMARRPFYARKMRLENLLRLGRASGWRRRPVLGRKAALLRRGAKDLVHHRFSSGAKENANENATHLERTQQRLVHAHHPARIVEFTAIVRRREDRHQMTLGEEFVAVLDDLFSDD